MVQELVSAAGGGVAAIIRAAAELGRRSGSAGMPMASSRAVDDHQRIRNPRVLDAMRKVPRHLFVPPDMQREAYVNRPLPIGFGQTISQPFIVAMMTELLEPKAGRKDSRDRHRQRLSGRDPDGVHI